MLPSTRSVAESLAPISPRVAPRELEGRAARDHPGVGQVRDGVEDLLADALAEAALALAVAEIDEGKDRHHLALRGRDRLEPRDEAVAPLGMGLDRRVAQLLAQEEDQLGEVFFLDHHVGPERVDELLLAQDAARLLHQLHEQVHRLGHQRNRDSLAKQHALRGVEPEAAEREDLACGHARSPAGRKKPESRKDCLEPLVYLRPTSTRSEDAMIAIRPTIALASLAAAATLAAGTFPLINPAQLAWKPKDALPPGAHGRWFAATRMKGPTHSSGGSRRSSPFRCTSTPTTSRW